MSIRTLLSSAAAIALFTGVAIAQTGGGAAGSGTGGSPGVNSGPGGAGSRPSGSMTSEPSRGGSQLGTGEQRPSGPRSGANESAPSNRSGAADSNSASGERSGAAERQGSGSQRSDQTGSIASGGNITSQQKTEIRSHISSVNIKAATNVNLPKVSVGVVVPSTIEPYWEPVPASIVEIVPAWRSYRVVKIHDEIVIIEPSTRKIVYVIES
jgi:hypothetical protein